MRRVVAAAFVSLDGVIQAPGSPTEDPTGGFRFGGWTAPHADSATGDWVMGLFESPFELLLGRRTYEIFAAYWPFMPPDHPIAARFNAVTKYVATRAGAPLTWANSISLANAVADVEALKRGDGPPLLTQGSGDLLKSLIAAGLIDEYRVMTYPVILGRGKRLFGADGAPTGLRLTRSTVSATGVILSVYEPAGPVPTGSFNVIDPTPLEAARQDRMAREQ